MTAKTNTYPTPLQDAWNAAEDRWLTEKREQQAAIREDRLTLHKSDLLAEAQGLKIHDAKITDTKAVLADKIAQRLWQDSPMNKRFAEIRKAASREEAAIEAMQNAPKAVDKARQAVVDKATEKTGWVAENTIRAALELATAVQFKRLWGEVESRVTTGDLADRPTVVEAVEAVGREVVGEILSNVRYAEGRSSSAASNIVHDAETQARARWVNEAGRIVPALKDLFAW